MSKSDIIAHVAESAGLSKKQATDAFDAAVQAIESAIWDCGPGDSVRVPGLGTLHGARARGAHGAQSADRRDYPDCGQPLGWFQGRQVAQGRGRPLTLRWSRVDGPGSMVPTGPSRGTRRLRLATPERRVRRPDARTSRPAEAALFGLEISL